ncbi:hypothetical protein GSI_03008 [Ganoderma sinense ZZ0214-1]|uniref:Protein-S-isoprenylcysteine O-methyltransferase n=1 Tax=Ganoderma sinense ZZ0214-1 TaxID=1077348 RepID=A0A2G8SNR7_9APHY|nr:hypothetical protein GSI_03008 [Ganoderma sinense ZZ0214-1]
MAYIAKLPAFAIITLAETVSFKSPQPLPDSEDRAKYGSEDFITRSKGWYTRICLGPSYLLHIAEVAAILARAYPAHRLSAPVLARLFPDPARVSALKLSAPFVGGGLLLVAGTWIRKRCYETLGKFFTFQLALFKEHKLVTWGPYGVVRHPSYSGLLLGIAGIVTVGLGPGSYLYESGMLANPWVAGPAAAWALWWASVAGGVVRRVSTEDEVLRNRFGQEWEEWAKRTPYKLVPYVY